MYFQTIMYVWTCSAPFFETLKYAKEYAEAIMYPNIANLLTIILTLSVTNVETVRCSQPSNA